eukprot:3300739-Karenia_brevis.AAC.1
MGSTEKRLEYESCRNYMVSIAKQRIAARIPKPADINNVDQQEEETETENSNNYQEGYYGWDVGAITNPTNPNIICHGCGEKGHIIANCPKKGE